MVKLKMHADMKLTNNGFWFFNDFSLITRYMILILGCTTNNY